MANFVRLLLARLLFTTYLPHYFVVFVVFRLQGYSATTIFNATRQTRYATLSGDTTMQPGFNCKANSAWHAWQEAGHAWRRLNPNADHQSTNQAALNFANVDGWPDAGKNARYRAFMECARVAGLL
jgi:hypothetical protein